MAVWTVTGVGQGGEAFRNCKIVAVPESGGGMTFLIFTPNGELPIISSTSNPPSWSGFQLGGLTWNVTQTLAIPRNPPHGHIPTLAGFYSNWGGRARPESAEGSWQAEPTGGGPRPKPPKKSSAKSSRKLSKKSPSKSSSKKSPRKPTSKKSSAKSSRKRSS
jgi:hypothetical protein